MTLPLHALINIPSGLNNFSQLIRCLHRFDSMKHCVAIRANGTKLIDGVDFVVLGNLGERDEMMNLNVANAKLPVNLSEVEITNYALRSPMIQASTSCVSVAFESIDQHGSYGSFGELA